MAETDPADVFLWKVRVSVDRIPDGVEFLDGLAYLEPTLRPLDHRRCELEVSVREVDYDAAVAYVDERVTEIRHAIDVRQAQELLGEGRAPSLIEL